MTALMNPFLAFGPMAIWVAEQPKQISPEPRYSPYFDIPQEDKFTRSDLWNGHWVYWVGSVAGALIAAVAFRLQGIKRSRIPKVPYMRTLIGEQ